MNNDLISHYALKKTFDEYGEKAKFTQGACQHCGAKMDGGADKC